MRAYFYYIVGFVLFFSCGKDSSESTNDNGTGGSMARFVLVDNFLYIVDYTKLSTYDVSNPGSPVFVNKQDVGFGIETLYPFEEYLLIGSTTGMYIYDIGSNGVPQIISNYEHFESCDPVVAQGNYAYVTLRSTRSCGSFGEYNRLEVIDISNVNSPNQVYVYDMAEPKGLAVEGNYLFVCSADLGVIVFDITDPSQPAPFDTLAGFTANDVIAKDNTLMVVCDDGLRQFDYTDINNITDLSFYSVPF
ncbi:MAG: hypothetical protein LRY27_02340 [Chitinophagales bacterium]|nr:hypothetical protein [Chitinophagales bacterium]